MNQQAEKNNWVLSKPIGVLSKDAKEPTACMVNIDSMHTEYQC